MPRAAATMPRAPAARRSRAGASPAGTGCRHAHAPLESLFPTLEVEPVRKRRLASREEARRERLADLEGDATRPRLHAALGCRAPEPAEQPAA
jgi:hypothetical protein